MRQENRPWRLFPQGNGRAFSPSSWCRRPGKHVSRRKAWQALGNMWPRLRPPPAEHAVLTKNVRSKKHVVPEKRSCGTHSFFRRFWVGPKCAFFLEVCEFCQNRHTVQYITRVGKAKKNVKKRYEIFMKSKAFHGNSKGRKGKTRRSGGGEAPLFPLDPRGRSAL